MDLFSPNIHPPRDTSTLTGIVLRSLIFFALILGVGPTLAEDEVQITKDAVYRELAQSYNSPNPFNPHTTINYSLLRDGWVQVDVFDLRGRLVVTLIDEYQSQGDHIAIWKTETSPSGTYLFFIRMLLSTKFNYIIRNLN